MNNRHSDNNRNRTKAMNLSLILNVIQVLVARRFVANIFAATRLLFVKLRKRLRPLAFKDLNDQTFSLNV